MIYLFLILALIVCALVYFLNESPSERDARIKAHQDNINKDRGCE